MGKRRAFTLIEVMVVMAIIAVLAVLIIGAITIARHTATETTNRSNAKTVQTGLEGYYAKNKAYPATSGSVSCTSAATTTSVSLASTTTASTCAAAGANEGGCHVTYSTSGYTIYPRTWDCSADMGASDQLTVN